MNNKPKANPEIPSDEHMVISGKYQSNLTTNKNTDLKSKGLQRNWIYCCHQIYIIVFIVDELAIIDSAAIYCDI